MNQGGGGGGGAIQSLIVSGKGELSYECGASSLLNGAGCLLTDF